MSEEIIIMPEIHYPEVMASPDAYQTRDQLIIQARKGNSITSDEGLKRVTAIIKSIDSFRSSVEAAKIRAKEPLLTITREIDAVHDSLLEDVKAEKARLSRLAGDYGARKLQAEREAQKKRNEEMMRLAREQAAEEEAKAAAAREQWERDRKEEEEMGDPVQEDAPLAEVEETPEQIQAREAREKRMRELQAEQEKVAKSKPKGLAIREVIEFEVEDIETLYESNPSCVKLTPIRSMITAALKALKGDQTLPGVKHWKEAKASVRKS